VFPKILRQLRLEQKLTQSDMAKVLNISRVAYTNYELGNREPDFGTITRIANFLGTTVDSLLGNSTVRTPPADYANAQHAPSANMLPPSLRLILNSVSDLSNESCANLQSYIELLRIKDEAANRKKRGGFINPDRDTHSKNDGH